MNSVKLPPKPFLNTSVGATGLPQQQDTDAGKAAPKPKTQTTLNDRFQDTYTASASAPHEVDASSAWKTMSAAQRNLMWGTSETVDDVPKLTSPAPYQASEDAVFEYGPKPGAKVLDTVFKAFAESKEPVDRPFLAGRYMLTFRNEFDPFVVGPQTLVGATLDGLSWSGGSTDFLKRLLALKPNLEFRDEKGNTPLFYATYGDSFAQLIRAGANPTATNNAGVSPMAYFANDATALGLSLKHGGAQNQKQVDEVFRRIVGLDPFGAYHEAGPRMARSPRQSSVRELLAQLSAHSVKLSPDVLAESFERLFDFRARTSGEFAGQFIEAADELKTLVRNSRSQFETRVGGETVLGHLGRFDSKSALGIMETMLGAGANPNALTSAGVPPLLDVQKPGFRSAGAVKALLAHGAAVDVKTEDGVTPLMQYFKSDAYLQLVEKTKQLDARDANGNTALMYQAGFDHRNVEALITAGANVNARNLDGHTALTYALGSQYLPRVALALVRGGAGVTDAAPVSKEFGSVSLGAAVLGATMLGPRLGYDNPETVVELIEAVVAAPGFRFDRNNPSEVNMAKQILTKLANGGYPKLSPAAISALQAAAQTART